MAMNPMQLLQMKSRLDIFKRQHPKILPFLQDVSGAIDEGSLIELRITTAAGKKYAAGMKVTAQDLETIRMLSKK